MIGILLSIASILIAINCFSNHNRILDLESKMESFEFRLNALLGCQAGLKKEILHLQETKQDNVKLGMSEAREGTQHD